MDRGGSVASEVREGQALVSLESLDIEARIASAEAAAQLARQWHARIAALAEDGAEAVAKFQAGDFDAVVMDIQIPVLDGLQATRKIRELEKDREHRTPIIALTAHVARGDRPQVR